MDGTGSRKRPTRAGAGERAPSSLPSAAAAMFPGCGCRGEAQSSSPAGVSPGTWREAGGRTSPSSAPGVTQRSLLEHASIIRSLQTGDRGARAWGPGQVDPGPRPWLRGRWQPRSSPTFVQTKTPGGPASSSPPHSPGKTCVLPGGDIRPWAGREAGALCRRPVAPDVPDRRLLQVLGLRCPGRGGVWPPRPVDLPRRRTRHAQRLPLAQSPSPGLRLDFRSRDLPLPRP